MKLNGFLRVPLLFVALTWLWGCKDDSKLNGKKPPERPLLIYASIQPIAFIAAKIAGRYAEVKALIPPGKDPHSFTLIASDLGAMAKARFFFSVRLPFEELKLKKAFKSSVTQWMDITAGIRFQPLEADEDDRHSAAAGGHDHPVELMDPHIWLDPANDLILARNICNILTKAMPQHAEYFELNYKNFSRCLTALDTKLTKMLAPFKGEIFLVYHPAFGYFARRYGLKQEAIEPGGKEPSPKHLQQVIALALKKKVHIVFVQPEFNRKAASVIARTIKGTVIKLDPLAYNLVDNYITFTAKIQAAMRREKTADRTDEKK
ncbi:MAG: zinc ABC transporter substrate-binding protein [Victivallaceae bacterium]|nr:zinc ABC transporter substrate-binding protein [Victivallaceae bacterium]